MTILNDAKFLPIDSPVQWSVHYRTKWCHSRVTWPDSQLLSGHSQRMYRPPVKLNQQEYSEPMKTSLRPAIDWWLLTGVDIWNLTSAFSPRSASDTTGVKITEPIAVLCQKKVIDEHNIMLLIILLPVGQKIWIIKKINPAWYHRLVIHGNWFIHSILARGSPHTSQISYLLLWPSLGLLVLGQSSHFRHCFLNNLLLTSVPARAYWWSISPWYKSVISLKGGYKILGTPVLAKYTCILMCLTKFLMMKSDISLVLTSGIEIGAVLTLSQDGRLSLMSFNITVTGNVSYDGTES